MLVVGDPYTKSTLPTPSATNSYDYKPSTILHTEVFNGYTVTYTAHIEESWVNDNHSRTVHLVTTDQPSWDPALSENTPDFKEILAVDYNGDGRFDWLCVQTFSGLTDCVSLTDEGKKLYADSKLTNEQAASAQLVAHNALEQFLNGGISYVWEL